MKQCSSLLCALSLFTLLLCIVLLLLPLQPLQDLSTLNHDSSNDSCLFSLSPSEIDRIHIERNNHMVTLFNLGNRFAIQGYEELILDLSPLTALLSKFPLSSITDETLSDPQIQMEIYSTDGKIIELSLQHHRKNILLSDGAQTYSYPKRLLEPLLSNAEDWIDLTICSSPPPQEAMLVITGDLHQEPLQLSYYIDDQSAAVLCNGKKTTPAPALRLLDQLYQCKAQRIEQLAPSTEDISFWGLNPPFCLLDAQLDGEHFSLSFSKPQNDGTVYFIKEGTPLLYSAHYSDFPFLSATQETILEQSVFSGDYEDTTSLFLSTQENSYHFTKWDGIVLCNGQPVEEHSFYDFYKFSTTLIPKEALVVKAEESNQLLHLELSYTNPEKQTDTIDFYSYSESLCLLRINGANDILIDRRTVSKIISSCQALCS